MTRTPFLVAALLGLALTTSASAGPVEDLARLVRESAGSPNPTMALLRGLAGQPDFSLNQAQVRQALNQAQVPSGSALDRLLRPTTRLSKAGDRITANRSETTLVTVPGGQGAVELGQTVKVRLRVTGPQEAALDKVSGIKVGVSASDLYTLFNVHFKRENGRQVAVVTAGVDLFLTSITKTVTIDLTPPASTPTSTGFAGAIGQ